MRERVDGVAVNTGHGLGANHGIDNRLFRCFDSGLEQGADPFV